MKAILRLLFVCCICGFLVGCQQEVGSQNPNVDAPIPEHGGDAPDYDAEGGEGGGGGEHAP
jgi:hypothetical protein